MNENLCIAIITTASIFAGFLVAFLSSYLTTRNREYEENRRKFESLGRKLTLFRQLFGFVWSSKCLNEQRRKQKANEPAFDEDGYVKSFMHAIDALHRDLMLKQYKQNPYIDYREADLARMKTLVNSIWYDLIHKNYQRFVSVIRLIVNLVYHKAISLQSARNSHSEISFPARVWMTESLDQLLVT